MLGPEVLFEGSQPVSADIVFVHGLRGDRIETWSEGRVCWPRDFLPKEPELENARIITWGYDSSVLHLKGTSSQNSVYAHATNLLNDLVRIRRRKEERARSLLFVAHSLGGIIVKQALIIASTHFHTQRDKAIGLVFSSTDGVIFMGTPHRGSDKAFWARMIERIAKAALKTPNHSLVQSLGMDSDVLENQRGEFTSISKDLIIVSLFEDTPIAGGMVVEKWSACLDMFNERAESLSGNHMEITKYPNVQSLAYQKTSCHIIRLLTEAAEKRAKFECPNAEIGGSNPRAFHRLRISDQPPVDSRALLGPSAEYQSLGAVGQEEYSVEEALDGESKPYHRNKSVDTDERSSSGLVEDMILSSLSSGVSNRRFEEIQPAYQETFEWIYSEQRSPYVNWLENGDGIFWINGKAGSGKSTLMKFLCEDPRTLGHLKTWQSQPNLFFVTFFFHSRGSPLQKSQLGLLRSILHQILSQAKDLIPLVFPGTCAELSRELRLHSVLNNGLDQTRGPPWSFRALSKGLVRLFEQDRVPVEIFLMIDGLDEYEGYQQQNKVEDYEEIVRIFHALAEKRPGLTRAKICLSSRPWPIFKDAFSNDPTLRLQDITQNDIRKYLCGTLGGDRVLRASLASEKDLDRLIYDIECHAEGVFLWATLAAKRVLSHVRNGDSISEIKNGLSDLPETLEDLFMHMLKDISPLYLDETCRIFQMFERSIMPLTLIDLYYALRGENEAVTAPIRRLTDSDALRISLEMERRLSSRCGGLVEFHPHKPGAAWKDRTSRVLSSRHPNLLQTVQYLHQSVRDFIQRPSIRDWLSHHMSRTSTYTNVQLLASHLQQLKDFDPNPQAVPGTAFLEPDSSGGFTDDDSEAEYGFRWDLRRDAMVYAFRAEEETKESQAFLLDELDRVCTVEQRARRQVRWLTYRRHWQHKESREKSWAHFQRLDDPRVQQDLHWCVDRWEGIARREPFPIHWNDSFLSFAMTYRLGRYAREKINSPGFEINKPGRPWLAYLVSNEVQLLSGHLAPPMNRSTLKVISHLLQRGADPNAHPLGAVELCLYHAAPPRYSNFDTLLSVALGERADVSVLRLLVRHGADAATEAPCIEVSNGLVTRTAPYSLAPTSNIFAGSLLDYVDARLNIASEDQKPALIAFREELLTQPPSAKGMYPAATSSDPTDDFQLLGTVPKSSADTLGLLGLSLPATLCSVM